MTLRLEKPKVDPLGVKEVGKEGVGIASYNIWFVGAGWLGVIESVDSYVLVVMEGLIRTWNDDNGSVDVYQVCKSAFRSAIEQRALGWNGASSLTLLLWFIPNDLIVFRKIR